MSLLADFGGQLGLWLGFSVITVAEVFILCIKLINVVCFQTPVRKASTVLKQQIFKSPGGASFVPQSAANGEKDNLFTYEIVVNNNFE